MMATEMKILHLWKIIGTDDKCRYYKNYKKPQHIKLSESQNVIRDIKYLYILT